MVLGIGTDLMRIDQIFAPYLQQDDPFVSATFTAAEQQAASASANPHRFYALRFCGKEAVFKALGLSPEHVRLCEIEILNDRNGAPTVELSGMLKERAAARGIFRVLISLTGTDDLVQAVALAQDAAEI